MATLSLAVALFGGAACDSSGAGSESSAATAAPTDGTQDTPAPAGNPSGGGPNGEGGNSSPASEPEPGPQGPPVGGLPGSGGASGPSGPGPEPDPVDPFPTPPVPGESGPLPEPEGSSNGGASGGSSSGGTPVTDGGAAGNVNGPNGGANANGGVGGSVPSGPSGTPIVYVGGYDYSGNAYPLSTYDLDKETGALTPRGAPVDAGTNPSYLALAPSKDFLYVANESDDAAGGLSALAIGADGGLTFLNHQGGSDGGFTFVAVDPSGRYAFGASYNGGSVSVFPIEDDGSLGPELQSRDFGGGAQSHCVGFDPLGQFVLVPNKGNNQVAQLLLGADGRLSDNTPGAVDSDPGAGPRHIAVHPNGKLAFVMNELGNSMTPYQLSADGTLTKGTSVSSLPAGFNGQSTGGHVELSPDGRFVYGSNRGDDSIVVFSADQETGALTLLERESSGGRTPRDFEVDPAGDVLIVANQDSRTLNVFAIADDGTLNPLGDSQDGPPSPSGVQIVYLEE